MSTYPAKPGQQPAEPRPGSLAAGLKKIADDAGPKTPMRIGIGQGPAAPDRFNLDEDALRALGLQGAGARLIQAILDKPGIQADELLEKAEVHGSNMAAAAGILMDKGYIEIKMVRDPEKRGGMVKAYFATKEGLRNAIEGQISTLRSVADRLRGA